MKYDNEFIKEFEEKFPLFSKDLPTFEDWLPTLLCHYYPFVFHYKQYIRHIKDKGLYEKIHEIHYQHKIKYANESGLSELKLWLEKYPKYYPECKKIWSKWL